MNRAWVVYLADETGIMPQALPALGSGDGQI